MSGLNCPHCGADNYKMKDPSELPWEDDDHREMTCSMCDKTFWVQAFATVNWNTYPTEEDFDNR